MKSRIKLISLLVTVLYVLAACAPPSVDTTPPKPVDTALPAPTEPTDTALPTPTETAEEETVKVEADLDDVFTIAVSGERQALPSPKQAFLEVGQGVDVDDQGRAVVRFADLLTVQVLRDGELRLQELSADEQSAVITVLHSGGSLINDFNPKKEIDHRFTVQTEFATITATGTFFLVAREADSPLEWVVGLDAGESDLEVTAKGVTKPVPTGTARWIAPIGVPSPGIAADMPNLQSWIEKAQKGLPVREVGEVVFPHADVVVDTHSLAELPEPGQTFKLADVELVLDPQGLFGSPTYWLEDCNGDGISDIAIEAGKLHLDFRTVLARVRALDVTLFNRGEPGSGVLRALDPGQSEIGTQQVEVSSGEGQILSLRTDQPYHFAELAMSNGCFLGFSLTPPDPDGGAGAPRPAVDNWQGRPSTFVRIDQPKDSSIAIANGFTLAGESSVPFERTLRLLVETADGRTIQTQSIRVEGGEPGGDPGSFETRVVVDYALPAEIRLRVQNISAEDGTILAEDSLLLVPLLPQFSERPPQNGWMRALPVGSSGYDTLIAVDGVPSDWDVLARMTGIGWTDFEAVVYDDGCVNNYSLLSSSRVDLRGQVYFAYDQNYLFVAFRVADDTYVSYAGRDQRYFLSDSPQLSLDTDLAADYLVRELNADDLQVDFSPGDGPVGDPLIARVALWQLDTLESREFGQALAMASLADAGYFLEAALPWKYLGFVPQPGARLGIAASVSDNDSPDAVVQECMISTAPGREWNDPTTWGTLVLVEP